MYQEPNKSPWGAVQTCDTLCPGVFLVSTASHGGTMVSKEVAAFLSPAAKRCGFQRGGYLCFEFGLGQHVAVSMILQEYGYTDIALRKDLRGVIRAARGTKK